MLTNYYSLHSAKIVKNSVLLAFLLFVVNIFFTANLEAQTILYAGDIAFTGVNMDDTDEFSIVFLVDIEIGTEIKFTDNGWLSTDEFRSGEGVDTWTAGSAYSTGDEITITASNMILSASGDQIIAYQNTSDMIAAINVEGANVWQEGSDSSNESDLPLGLTNGENCVALTETDNIMYDRSVTSGTKIELLNAINDYTNWSGSNSTTQTLSNTGYTITAQAEPSDHVTDFVGTDFTHKDITTNWTDVDGTEAADGYLVMINLSGTFSAPVDGTPQVDDTDISDGDGAVNIAHGVQTYIWTDLSSSESYYFEIFPYTSYGGSINYKTDSPPQASGTTTAAPDSDSDITAPSSQVGGTTISSLLDTDAEAIDVFTFKIIDSGTLDSHATIVDTITIRPNSTNTTDWTDHIQGAKLNSGGNITLDNVEITDAYIKIAIPSGNLTVASGGSSEVTLSIYLNTSNIEDGEILSFYIDDKAHGFVADEYGSTFTSDPLSADIVSNDFTVDVVATKLVFNSVPSDININTDFTAEVWATDANGNLDINDASSVTLTSSGGGTLSSSNSQTLTESLSNGIYSWTGLQNDTEETFNLTAANGTTDAVSSITAYASGVAIPGSIFISEIMVNPSGTEPDREWFELYNTNTFPVDLNGWSITDAGTNSISVSVSTSIAANGFYTFGKSDDPLSNGNYDADFDYSASTFLLDNDIDEIIIDNGSFEITRVEYDNTNGWTITNGSSLIFTGTANDNNNDASLWIASTLHEKDYLGTTNTDYGSPGRNGFGQDFVSTATWTGSGNWSEGNLVGNTYWDNGVPGPSTNVTIDGTATVDISTPAVCNDLTISSGNSLTISAGNALTVYGNLENNSGSASGLSLDADASSVSSLITKGSITGDATVISYFTDLSKYYLVSPPISNALGSVFTGDVVYYYDEPNYTWQNPTNLDFSFEAGIGYAIYKNTDNTVTYSGTLNTGAISNTLTYANAGHSSPVDGWNLMGNPYPSVLDISYLDYTDISNGVWVNLHNSTSDYYVYWSKTLGTVGSSGEGGGDIRARYIQPGQGFWIYTDINSTAFNLDNSMRTHQNQGVFSKSAEANTDDTLDEILKISVSGNGITDPAYILFRPNASLDFDRDYDLLKMTSSSATVPHIFSLTTEEYPQKLAINAIAKPQSETVVPLGLKIGTDGTYLLYFDGMNSFEDSQDFYLRDRLNGELFDIRQEPVIEFTHSTSNEEHRFDLVMGLQTDINTLGVSIPAEVYSFRNTLYIRPGLNQEIIQVKLRNLLGQIVYSRAFNTSFITGVQLNLPSAFYLVDLQLKSSTYSKKIFIQNLN